MQQLVHDTVARALAPYRDTGRLPHLLVCGEVLPGVRPVNLAGHTPGHTGYLLGEGDATVLFWGDTVHSHTVQLRRPSVTMAADSDEPAAIAARRKAFDLASMNRWWVGAAHLPFPASATFGATGRYAGCPSRTRRAKHRPPSQTPRHIRSCGPSAGSAGIANAVVG